MAHTFLHLSHKSEQKNLVHNKPWGPQTWLENRGWPLGDKKFPFKGNLVSPSGHVIFSLLYKHPWNTNHFTLILFLKQNMERYVFHVTIATVMFSCLKITCYLHVWRYHVLNTCKLAWYFISIYVIRGIYLPDCILYI